MTSTPKDYDRESTERRADTLFVEEAVVAQLSRGDRIALAVYLFNNELRNRVSLICYMHDHPDEFVAARAAIKLGVKR